MKVTNISTQNNQQYHTQNLGSEVLKAIELLRDNSLTVGFAESCTGGLLSSEFTKKSGVSDVFTGSVVCYSNSVKENVLGVSSETLIKFGAVSAECAEQLSAGVLKKLSSTVGIAITGVAGPTGGSVQKPVGTVYISVAGTDSVKKQAVIKTYCHQFGQTGREEIQKAACLAALDHLQDLIKEINKS